jgi:hypothetical protein
MELMALEKYMDGRCQPVQYVDTGRNNPEGLSLMFWFVEKSYTNDKSVRIGHFSGDKALHSRIADEAYSPAKVYEHINILHIILYHIIKYYVPYYELTYMIE